MPPGTSSALNWNYFCWKTDWNNAMSKQTESLLQSILDELRLIREEIVKPPLPTPAELERDLSVVLGTGPEEFGNK
jgi:hypothetical protein